MKKLLYNHDLTYITLKEVKSDLMDIGIGYQNFGGKKHNSLWFLDKNTYLKLSRNSFVFHILSQNEKENRIIPLR